MAAGLGSGLAGPAGEAGIVAGVGGGDLVQQVGLGVLVGGDLGGVGGGSLAALYVRHSPWLLVRLSRRCSDRSLVDEVGAGHLCRGVAGRAALVGPR